MEYFSLELNDIVVFVICSFINDMGGEVNMPDQSSTALKTAAYTERLRKIMPYGSSTGSKAPVHLPEEPGVIERGEGCRVWDVDGREFIDFRNGLGPVTLGYRYPAIDEAIRKQLEKGIVFGHPHRLELEAAEKFCELVPCAEQARFLKTGGEAIAAAIKIARAAAGKDHIIQIGYNGWVNSLAVGGAVLPRQKAVTLPGVPSSLSQLHHAAGWNDMERLEQLFTALDGQIAAVVVAASYAKMEEGKTFYPALRALTQKHGALLIYDEIVTGFRIAIGGVQEYFGVVPDLAVFSKGIANGMPLSVYAGKKEFMSYCGPGKASISTTFGGETLSLAAAIACMEIYEQQDVSGFLWRQGEKMWSGLKRLFQSYEIPLDIQGFWPCPEFVPTNNEPAALSQFMRLAYKHGVSLYNVSYVNFSHRDEDIAEALQRLERACAEFKQCENENERA